MDSFSIRPGGELGQGECRVSLMPLAVDMDVPSNITRDDPNLPDEIAHPGRPARPFPPLAARGGEHGVRPSGTSRTGPATARMKPKPDAGCTRSASRRE